MDFPQSRSCTTRIWVCTTGWRPRLYLCTPSPALRLRVVAYLVKTSLEPPGQSGLPRKFPRPLRRSLTPSSDSQKFIRVYLLYLILPKTSSGGQFFWLQDIKKQRERRKTKAEEGRQKKEEDTWRHLKNRLFSRAAPANQTKERSVHELFGTKVQCELCLFSRGKTPEFTKKGEIHELFVLALSLVWFAGATPDFWWGLFMSPISP